MALRSAANSYKLHSNHSQRHFSRRTLFLWLFNVEIQGHLYLPQSFQHIWMQSLVGHHFQANSLVSDWVFSLFQPLRRFSFNRVTNYLAIRQVWFHGESTSQYYFETISFSENLCGLFEKLFFGKIELIKMVLRMLDLPLKFVCTASQTYSRI